MLDIDTQHCPNCGAGELEIIAAILDRPVIEKILTHLGLQPQPPPAAPARELVRYQRTELQTPSCPVRTMPPATEKEGSGPGVWAVLGFA